MVIERSGVGSSWHAIHYFGHSSFLDYLMQYAFDIVPGQDNDNNNQQGKLTLQSFQFCIEIHVIA